MNRTEYVAGLLAAASFYEAHPEVPLPGEKFLTNYHCHTRQEAVVIAKALGACKKEYGDALFFLIKEISPGFFLRFVFSRSRVCERVKVGEKIIPEHTLPAREETVVPEEIEEVFEWKCPESLLAEETL